MNVNEVTKLSKTPLKCIETREKFEFYEYPYYKAGKQRSLVPQKKKWFRLQYPHQTFISELRDHANSIHALNYFKEEGCGVQFQC